MAFIIKVTCEEDMLVHLTRAIKEAGGSIIDLDVAEPRRNVAKFVSNGKRTPSSVIAPRGDRKVTSEELANYLTMSESGSTHAEIAVKHGRSSGAVAHQLRLVAHGEKKDPRTIR